MKMYLISDNVDTLTGMRLAGVEGVVVHGLYKLYPQQAISSKYEAAKDVYHNLP